MSTKNGIRIDRLFIDKDRAIKEIDDLGIVNANKTSTAQSKDLVKAGISFLISEARLAFIELRLAFIKTLIFHYYNLEYHI